MSEVRPHLEGWRPPTKLKLAALWASVMFLYIYGDYFNLYTPGKLEAMAAGSIGPLGEATPAVLVAISLVRAVPALMIAASLIAPLWLSRILNVLFGLAFSVIVALTLPGAPAFYIVYGALEISLTLLIAGAAVFWPRTTSDNN